MTDLSQQIARDEQILAQGFATLAAYKPQSEPKQIAPEWTAPAHEEINLATVSHEDLGLDPYDYDNPLVRKIYKAQEQADPLPFVPAELKQKPNWVRWKLETVNERLTKVPYQLNGSKAASNNTETWTTFEKITKDAVIDDTQGIGIMTDGSFIGFDLDGCRNPATGEIKQWAQRIVEMLGTYTEITPSGTGVRVYALGKLPDGPRRFSIGLSAGHGEKVGIETYDSVRYFAVTGNRFGNTSAMWSPNVLQAYQMCAQISKEFPAEKRQQAVGFNADDRGSVQIELAPGKLVMTTKLALLMYGTVVSEKPFVVQDEHGNKLTYPSHSEADMALATLLAMKHQDNPEQIDSEFRESPLYRSKWERRDYSDGTIRKAIESAKRLNSDEPISVTAQAQADAAVIASSEEPEETFEDTEEPFPECPIFPGALTDLARALFPSLPLEFKQWGLITRWGVMRSGIDSLENESHLQPRFYTTLVSHQPNIGKTACINESRDAMDRISKTARVLVAEKNKHERTSRVCADVENLESADSGPFLVQEFSDVAEEAHKQYQNSSCSDDRAKIILDPDELSDVFEKARTTNTRQSTLFQELLKLHSGNRTGSGTKRDGKNSIPNAHLSVLAGVTRKKYPQLWIGTGSQSDGLVSRFIAVTTNNPPVPPSPLPSDIETAEQVYKRLVFLAQLPGQTIRLTEDARRKLNEWWTRIDTRNPNTTRILETVKQLLIVLTVTNLLDNHTGTIAICGPELVQAAIQFGDYEIAIRERLNPGDSWSNIQAMENGIITWFRKHAARNSPKTRNDCRRGIHPQRLPGGLGAFIMAWNNCVNTDVLKVRDKTQRTGAYSL